MGYEKQFLQNLIAMQSVGSAPEEGFPYGRKSKEVLDFFLEEAASQNMRCHITDNKAGYVEFGPEDSEKLFAMVCHLDVVPAGDGWVSDPFTLTVKDGKYFGRGIIDDKGPAAACFFAMRRLMAEGFEPKTRVRLILGTDEERTCSCIECYADKEEIPTFAITPDAEFPVIYAEKGILNVKIYSDRPSKIEANAGSATNMVPAGAQLTTGGVTYKASGVTAHASRPELGINAVYRLIEVLHNAGSDIKQSPLFTYIERELYGKEAGEYTGCRLSDESGRITANPAIICCSADGESLVTDIRYPVTADKDSIVSYMAGRAASYGLSVCETNHMPPLYKEKNTSGIKLLTDIWNSHMANYSGYRPEYAKQYSKPLAIGGGTYARHLPNTIAFGLQAPWQTDQCHQANESLSISDFEEDINVIREAIVRLTDVI
ncbi:MAG: Sapep family Mn(2+)-dependent dipeptidase [Mageeibacillus sp.]|jgi:succinyl-diaminopimelate desuccinylase|nr:Sapep family Mn(2+)-dependent dipeptidase [Mageeibacillus sp.]MCI1263703.1 Sapep family Mn(2+)-dependent dipeptidase [Saccharofermentans sp.]MCI2043715.1 Sapep family Mn(2+)-dependent dipeptidase [Mageeibacillus sp.]